MLRPRNKPVGTSSDDIDKFIKEHGLTVLSNSDNTGLHCSKYTKKVRANLLAKAAKRRVRETGRSILSDKRIK